MPKTVGKSFPASGKCISIQQYPLLLFGKIRIFRNYFAIYIACFMLIFFVLCFEPSFDFETNITATAACFNNVGPGFAGVGPMLNFANYSDLSKIVLSVAMLLGRLEIFPLILAGSLSTWRKQ